MINKWEKEERRRKRYQFITYLMLCFIIYNNTDERSNVFVDNQRRSSLLFDIGNTLVITSLFFHTVGTTKEFCITYLSHNRALWTYTAWGPYSEFFWYVFSCIWTEYGEILRNAPYSVRMRENRTKKTPNTDTFHVLFVHSVKKPKFYLISWCRNFVESFEWFVRTSTETTLSRQISTSTNLVKVWAFDSSYFQITKLLHWEKLRPQDDNLALHVSV